MALQFDAASDYIYQMPTHPGHNPITVLSWVRVYSPPAQEATIGKFPAGGGTNDGWGFSSTLAVRLRSNYDISDGQQVQTGIYYPITYVRDGANRYYYIGNSLAATLSANTVFTPQGLIMGSDTVWFLNGSLANIKIWQAALFLEEIEAEIASSSPVRLANLWGWYPTPFGSERLLDASGNGNHFLSSGTIEDVDNPSFSLSLYAEDEFVLDEQAGAQSDEGERNLSSGDNFSLSETVSVYREEPAPADNTDDARLYESQIRLNSTQFTDYAILREEGVVGKGEIIDLEIEGAQHAHWGEGVVEHWLSITLSIEDSAHAHTADEPGPFSIHLIQPESARHTHSADEAVIVVGSDLFIYDATHQHTADSPTINALIELQIEPALHAHTADSVNIAPAGQLVIESASHGHAADSPTLQRIVSLVIADSRHAHTVDGIGFTVMTNVITFVLELDMNPTFRARLDRNPQFVLGLDQNPQFTLEL